MYAIYLVSLMAIFMVCLWLIDISSSAMSIGHRIDNLFYKGVEPNFTYHIGLLGCFMCFMILNVVLSYKLEESKSKKNHDTDPNQDSVIRTINKVREDIAGRHNQT